MFNVPKNFIHSLLFELQFKKNNEPYQLPEITRQKFYEEILPVIEQVLNDVPQHVHIRIPSLVIDAGAVTMDELKVIVEKALREMIQDALIKSTNDNTSITAVHMQPVSYLHGQQKSIPDELYVFFQFIKTGMLPWHERQPAEINIKNILFNIIIFIKQKITRIDEEHIAKNILQQELESIFYNAKSCQRLLLHATPEQVFELVNVIRPALPAEDNKVLVSLLQLWHKTRGAHDSYMMAVTIAIQYYLENNLAGNVLYRLHHNTQWQNLLDKFITTEAAKEQRKWLYTVVQPKIEMEQEAVKKRKEKLNTAVQPAIILKPLAITGQAHRLPGEESSLYTSAESGQTTIPGINEIVSGGLAIYNAGLVLLCPFLPLLFEVLGICSDDEFTGEKSPVLATQVLHYLVFGTAKTPEYMMTLNKVLCGVPLEQPVPARLAVTSKIKNECRELLEHVTKQWKALSGTSTEGFRDAFLKRNGVLQRKEGAWELSVEAQGHDVLLDSLPWGIQLVKYSWNNYLLHVEWGRI